MFSLAVSCLIMSNLLQFMALTFQVPMHYCSLHQTLLSVPDTSTAELHFNFGPATSFLLELLIIALHFSPVAYSVQFSRSVVSDSCNLINCSTPGLPVHHQLPEFTQTHIHRVSDAIQPSHPQPSPFPPAPSPSQNQSLFQWVNPSHEVAKVLEFQLQHHSFQRTPRADLL